jgi:hypothetical protein
LCNERVYEYLSTSKVILRPVENTATDFPRIAITCCAGLEEAFTLPYLEMSSFRRCMHSLDIATFNNDLISPPPIQRHPISHAPVYLNSSQSSTSSAPPRPNRQCNSPQTTISPIPRDVDTCFTEMYFWTKSSPSSFTSFESVSRFSNASRTLRGNDFVIPALRLASSLSFPGSSTLNLRYNGR